MGSNFTRGPWVRDGTLLLGKDIEIDLRLDDRGKNWVTIKGEKDEVVEANAALVGAAPELANALLLFMQHEGPVYGGMSRERLNAVGSAALKKAGVTP